jgi:hypothetical protein
MQPEQALTSRSPMTPDHGGRADGGVRRVLLMIVESTEVAGDALCRVGPSGTRIAPLILGGMVLRVDRQRASLGFRTDPDVVAGGLVLIAWSGFPPAVRSSSS